MVGPEDGFEQQSFCLGCDGVKGLGVGEVEDYAGQHTPEGLDDGLTPVRGSEVYAFEDGYGSVLAG